MFKTLGTFFKSFQTQDSPRELTSPEQLVKGDMFRIADSYAIPEDLRGQTFQVQKVATYFYNDAATPQFIIKSGTNKPMFLSIEDFDGESQIVISKKLKSKEVEALFSWKRLRAAMKNENDRDIQPLKDATHDDWLAASYSRRVFGAKGQYFEKDLRHATQVPAGGEPFQYYEYYTDDETQSFEIEAWEGDELEVCLGLIRPMSDIEELWKHS